MFREREKTQRNGGKSEPITREREEKKKRERLTGKLRGIMVLCVRSRLVRSSYYSDSMLFRILRKQHTDTIMYEDKK